MEESTRSRTVITSHSSPHSDNFSTSTLAYDKHFIRTVPGFLIIAEIIFGLLVWTLIGGTEYFRVSAFGWVMFVAVFYWVLTVFFLIIYLTMAYTRIPQVPWTTVQCSRALPDGCCSGCCFHQPSRQGTTRLQQLGSLHVLCLLGSAVLPGKCVLQF
ncbi:CKLF-like MARVEL transmembrane domain-containing protein 8b isoform X2 [Anguilla rostrata]|uniref:CKLF-like MARVEL transmembrane domain-containing protein 8b isoform X2 n=1 Tax=Anguilla rostrata TaxID=7938 RepID=UPI0030D13C0F